MNERDITIAEWYQEIERASTAQDGEDDGYRSTKEMGKTLGVSPATVRKYLDVFHEEGRLRHKDRRDIGKHGRPTVVPVYKVVPREESSGKEADGT